MRALAIEQILNLQTVCCWLNIMRFNLSLTKALEIICRILIIFHEFHACQISKRASWAKNCLLSITIRLNKFLYFFATALNEKCWKRVGNWVRFVNKRDEIKKLNLLNLWSENWLSLWWLFANNKEFNFANLWEN